MELRTLAPAPARLPLKAGDLDAFIASNGIEAALVKEEDKLNGSVGPAVIKSLVFMADSKPLLVVVLGSDKVESRKVADSLGVARRRVRLATPDEALQASGYQIGTIPPFGHVSKLHTILDAAVTQQSVVYGGGGDPDLEVMVAVPELLHFSQPEIADVAVRPPGPSPTPAPAPGPGLPLPWAPGSKAVRMVVMVTKTRRVARRLMFVNVVPESVQQLPEKTQASYLRRLWKSPLDLAGPPVEVQLILGSTIERTLGSQRCEELLSSIKVGAVLYISGIVQDRPQKATAPPEASPEPNSLEPGSLEPGSQDGSDPKGDIRSVSRTARSSSHHVLDVVCHRVSRVFTDKRALQQMLDKAQEAGDDWVVSAADLELLRWKQQQEQQQQQVADTAPSPDAHLQPQPEVIGQGPDAVASSSPLGKRSRSRASSAWQLAAPTLAAAVPGAWQLPLPMSSVSLVDSLRGVQLARQAVLGRLEAAGGGSAAASRGAVVVGIDCEWRPDVRGAPKGPVALMQVAMRNQVFLLDMMTLCNNGHSEASPAQGAGTGLSELQQEAGRFIKALLTTDQVLKLGFSLASDLDRLAESYPWILSLPSTPLGGGADGQGGDACAAATDGQPSGLSPRDAAVSKLAAAGEQIRGAVGCLDLAVLARAAAGIPAVTASSLSRLAEAVLGLPLDKTQQRSDWAQRPLTQEQLSYAAMDAHVLICILDRVLEPGEASQPGCTRTVSERVMAGNAASLSAALSSKGFL